MLNHQRVSLDDKPSIDEGCLVPEDRLRGQHEVLTEAKVVLTKAGETAHFYGNAAYEAVTHKIPITSMKEDTKKAVEAVS